MKNILFITLFLIYSLTLTSCGSSTLGGTEAGNPSMRNVNGQLSSNSNNTATLMAATHNCPADAVTAINSLAETFPATVNSDCTFTLSLPVNKSYAINFILDEAFVASMIFTNSSTSITATTFVLSSGNTDIDLGIISLNGSQAHPEDQPAQQNDRDDDGVFDFDDDFSDRDCDLDGYYDLFDDSDDECDVEDDDINDDNDNSSESTEQAEVFDVYPENEDEDIDPEDSIEVQLGCSVNETSVTAASFIVETDGNSIVCEHELSSSNQILECSPEENLQEETTYTVTLDGIECENGEIIPITSWSFTTGILD